MARALLPHTEGFTNLAKPTKKQQEIQTTWEERIRRSLAVRSSWKKLFNVDLAREYFEGKQRDPSYDAADWITINNVYSHLQSRLPALYQADPYFYVTLRRCYQIDKMTVAKYEAMAKIRQAKLNHLKDEVNLKPTVRLAIQDAHFAYGVVKTHYSADIFDNPKAGEPILGESEEPLYNERTGEALIEPDVIARNGHYKVTRVHPDDFIWDEDSGPLPDSWNWVAQRIKMPIADARRNRFYNQMALRKVEGKGQSKKDEDKAREERKKGDIAGRGEREDGKKAGTGEDPKVVVFWEIYDLKEKEWLTIAEGGEIPMRDPEPFPVGILGGMSYSILRFVLRDDSPYPIPPMSQGIDPSKEYNRARSDIQKHRKRFNRKYVLSRPSFGQEAETAASKVEHGDDGTVIIANSPDVRAALAPVQDAQLDQMRFQELAYLKGEMVELFGGTTEEARGIAGADSATQAGIMDKRLEVKEGDAMSMVIDFVLDIAKRLDTLVQVHLDTDEAVKVRGPQGEYWEMVRKTDYGSIEGEYDYTVNVGATQPRLPHIERASWQAFLAFLGAAPQFLLSKALLKKAAEMHHIEDDLLIEEMHEIGKMMMSGQVPTPGGGAGSSMAGVSEERPASAMAGMVNGLQALNLPGAGNLEQ